MVWWRKLSTDKGNHSRTGKVAETAIMPDCTLCYKIGENAQIFRLSPGVVQGLKLFKQQRFDQLAAADISGVGQLIQRVHRIRIEF